MYKPLVSLLILLFVTSLSPYAISSSAPTTQSVQSPFYPWNNTDSHNTQISLSNTGAKNFSATFTANASDNLAIGLYSSNYNRPNGLNTNTLSAIIECVIGGWDDGSPNKANQQSCIRFENDSGNNQTQNPIFFTDTAYPHQKYIIPGSRGADITYTCTIALSDTAFKLSITYIDPTTTTQNELLSITNADMPSSIFDYLRSSTFPGFTALSFRIYTNGYTVKNYSVQLQDITATPSPNTQEEPNVTVQPYAWNDPAQQN